jgi:hypothetical protein
LASFASLSSTAVFTAAKLLFTSAAFAVVPAVKSMSPVTCPAMSVALKVPNTPAASPAENAILLFMDDTSDVS